ncbi:hypothetical protein [Rickettsia conorii]|nr:hypothetical protein [Rickettsia conorii]
MKLWIYNLYRHSIKFGGRNATYDVSNESPNAAEFVASFNLVPANDVDGQLRVHVASGSREIALNAGSGNGTGGTIRLNKFLTDGIGAPLNHTPATITGTIFVQTIQIGNQYQPINIGVDTPYGVDWIPAREDYSTIYAELVSTISARCNF